LVTNNRIVCAHLYFNSLEIDFIANDKCVNVIDAYSKYVSMRL